MANTTWNAADKSGNITLSGTNNLVATSTSSVQGGVRAIAPALTGKSYWEYTCTTFGAAQDTVGIASGAVNLALTLGSQVGVACVINAGLIYIDGTYSGSAIGSIAGIVVCVAYDAGARLVWFRAGAAGNWNNSGTANPATATGGIGTPNLGSTINAFPVASLQLSTHQVTANFGDSAFAGVVPAGFTAGFPPSGGSSGGSAAQARVMVLA